MNAILSDAELRAISTRAGVRATHCAEGLLQTVRDDVPRLLAMIQQLQDELNLVTFEKGRGRDG